MPNHYFSVIPAQVGIHHYVIPTEASVLAFAPVPALSKGAGKKARGRSGGIYLNSFAEGESNSGRVGPALSMVEWVE